MPSTAPTNTRRPNRLKSTIGARWRRSASTNTSSSAAPAAKRSMVARLDQPATLASIRPQMMQNRPAENSAAPSGSKLAFDASFDSSTCLPTSHIRMATTGRFR